MKRGSATPSVRAAASARKPSRCSWTAPCRTVSATARGRRQHEHEIEADSRPMALGRFWGGQPVRDRP